MKLKKVLSDTAIKLSKSGIEGGARDARILTAYALEVPISDLLLKMNERVSGKIISKLEKLINRRINREPISKILERREFWGRTFSINKNVLENEFNVIDARSLERFKGQVPEPRKGLRSGSIKNSFCLPYSQLINQDHTFISKEKIYEKFKSTGYEMSKNTVFTCGSGVTASVLALAYSLIDNKYMPNIYDGSWSEYGKN